MCIINYTKWLPILHYMYIIQWNPFIKDTLGPTELSFEVSFIRVITIFEHHNMKIQQIHFLQYPVKLKLFFYMETNTHHLCLASCVVKKLIITTL